MKNFTLLDAIGNTPLIKLSFFSDDKIEFFAKFEGANPGGSVKDRTAKFMVEEGERNGKLKKGKIILEASSGNTGIALAMIGAAKGYKVKLVIPECVSMERRKVLEAFGAEIVLSCGKFKTDGAIKKAKKIFNKNPKKYFIPDQFSSKANILAHYKTTAPEIWKDLKGEINYLVAGMGTTGTIMGLSQYFKKKNPKIKIIGVEPMKNHAIQGLKNMEESIVPKIYNPQKIDKIIKVKDDKAFEITRKLAKKEGLFVGMSSGAAMAGALRLSRRIKKGKIVVIFPDRGDRYLSTNLFRSFCAKCAP